MSEYCKMSTNSQMTGGNEKTPINSSLHGAEKSSGSIEKYGGQDDNNVHNVASSDDELTGQQKKYVFLMS